ncbi:MAG: hypothetical protein ACRDFW_09120 [bacterium]
MSSKLQSFLASAKEVADALSPPSADPQMIQALVAAAQGRVKTWVKASPAEIREFLRSVISRIVVHEKYVEILASKRGMRQAVLDRSPSRGPTGEPTGISGKEHHDLLRMVIKARLRRCGGEVRLLLPAESVDNPLRTPSSLIKAIARARDWYERLVKGDVNDQRSIARRTGLDERYVSRIFQNAFLAPKIVEAILKGSHAPDLTLEKLRLPVPSDWSEQRKRFRFAIT